MESDDMLYIIIHVHKTGGTTIQTHVRFNFKQDQILILYRNRQKEFKTKNNIKDYISSLSQEQRDKIRVIIGHGAYYGIHEFFSKPYRYIIFFRDPVESVISNYNCEKFVEKYSHGRIISNLKNCSNIDEVIADNAINHDQFFEFLYRSLLNKKGDPVFNADNLQEMKDILNNFYFVGLTKNHDDFMFVYHKLGFKRFLFNYNVSKKYFKPSEEITKIISGNNQYDRDIYNYALILNRRFKDNYKNFSQEVLELKKRKRQSYLLTWPMVLIYRLSDTLRKYSKTYFNIMAFIDSKKIK